jgi:hypothetical protein
MIDFRYHLVSLVSVFLALAVGIVLGAGPLKEPISEGLSQSVQQLRQDRDALGEQLKTAQVAGRNRDAFIADVQGRLVANQLGGRGVLLVTLPGADADAVRPLTQALTSAGATVTGRVDLQEAWVDPADRAARDAAVAALRTSNGLPDPQQPGAGTAGPGGTASPSASRPSPSTPSGSTSSPSATAGTPTAGTPAVPGSTSDVAAAETLARALVTKELSASGRLDGTAQRLLDGLARAGLLEVSGQVTGRATQVVLLAPGVATALQGAVPTPSPSASPDLTPTWVTLGAVLDGASTGAVVLGPASSSTSGGVLAAVRAQPLAAGISTVDTGGSPMGDVTTVLALREQQLGAAGHYGNGDGATARLPPPPDS